MENMLKEFERVLNRKVGSRRELEIILTKMYNDILDENNQNTEKTFEIFDNQLEGLFSKYNMSIETYCEEEWELELNKDYDYSKVCEILNVDTPQLAMDIVESQVIKYAKENKCNHLHALNMVNIKLFGDEKPFLIDSYYEPPVVRVLPKRNRNYDSALKCLYVSHYIYIIRDDGKIEIVKCKDIIKMYNGLDLHVFDTIDKSNIRSIYCIIPYKTMSTFQYRIKCIYGEDTLIGLSNSNALEVIMDVIRH